MPTTFSSGDISNTNTIGVKDLTLLLSHLNNVSGHELTGNSLINADMNNDGNTDLNDVSYMKQYLVEKNTDTVYLDPVNLSGVFKFQLPTTDAVNNDIKNNLPIVNNDGSFTSLVVSTELSPSGNFTIVTVNYAFTNKPRTNDGVNLNNTNYHIIQWDNIPLSRNWDEFNSTYSGIGLFENFTGRNLSFNDDKPTILKTTSFKNIFKMLILDSEGNAISPQPVLEYYAYGNFDEWNTNGVTQISLQGLLIDGFQIAAKMKILDSAGNVIKTIDNAGYSGGYDIDIDPRDLSTDYTIVMTEAVDVAVAKENKITQGSKVSKKNGFRGVQNNITPLQSLVTSYFEFNPE